MNHDKDFKEVFGNIVDEIMKLTDINETKILKYIAYKLGYKSERQLYEWKRGKDSPHDVYSTIEELLDLLKLVRATESSALKKEILQANTVEKPTNKIRELERQVQHLTDSLEALKQENEELRRTTPQGSKDKITIDGITITLGSIHIKEF